jgi:hypothetical protein
MRVRHGLKAGRFEAVNSRNSDEWVEVTLLRQRHLGGQGDEVNESHRRVKRRGSRD